ncbi:hypothetical protein DPPLL_18700 [Desulfofustis limnaeus]|uniref:Uncharacterized protein n=1 Tax=Desulfofustis limnaeus TaxID=2740163 RepID=A0ABM7W990_9BACT|nr:hypothetical protein DPPLL_18700 [Desulfofustis limnaeus]
MSETGREQQKTPAGRRRRGSILMIAIPYGAGHTDTITTSTSTHTNPTSPAFRVPVVTVKRCAVAVIVWDMR